VYFINNIIFGFLQRKGKLLKEESKEMWTEVRFFTRFNIQDGA